MCGIAALFRRPDIRVAEGTLERMVEDVAHRGPDGSGVAYLPTGAQAWRTALGHRRLAILDLSEAGRQPMSNGCGLWITYNGEIYNYLELRRELEHLGLGFRTQTDTEVVLAAYQAWGEGCFQRFRGMWGLVLVDERRRRAVLSRDRLGIKPLYFTALPGLFAAASEPKQLRHLPRKLMPDDAAVRMYLANGYEDPHRTLFADVAPIPAGTCQVLDLDTLVLSPPTSYWFPERVTVSVHDPEEAARLVQKALSDAVLLHMRSDVPVGCALSGGLDSSSICAYAGKVQSFSVTFPGEPVDERSYIDQVVNHLGTTAHFVTPTAEGFLADLDDFLWKHDEPVGSLSQYAGWAVARLTHNAGVPVTLNGQGGDEVLSGYWQCYFVHLRRLVAELKLKELGVHLGGSLLPGGNPELVRQVPGMVRRYQARRKDAGGNTPIDHVRTLGAEAWRVYEVRELTLPRLLKWDDRNFMAFSVEGRYPFLDHEVIELCLSFSSEVLFDRGWTKEPLRRGLTGRLPPEILRRRTKVGFETPQDRWLAGPLRIHVERLLAGDSPAWRFISPQAARKLSPHHREEGQKLFRAFLVDRWLKRFELTA